MYSCPLPSSAYVNAFAPCIDHFEFLTNASQQLAGGMEAHLRNRRAPGVPLDAPAAETAAPMLEESGPGDGQQEQPNAAGDNGGAGTTPTGEALTQELGLLKASVGMVSSRLKELQKKDKRYKRGLETKIRGDIQREFARI